MNWYKIATQFDPERILDSTDDIVYEILLFIDYMKKWDKKEFVEKQEELNIFIDQLIKLESSEDIKLFLDEAPKLSDTQIKKLVLGIVRKSNFSDNSIRSFGWSDVVYYLRYFATEDDDFIKQVVEAAIKANDGSAAYQLLMFAPDIMVDFKEGLLAKILKDNNLVNLANIAIYGIKAEHGGIISKNDFDKIQDILIKSGDRAVLEYFVREAPQADKAKIAEKFLSLKPDYYSLLSFINSVKKAHVFGGDFGVLSDIIEKAGLYIARETNGSHEAQRLLDYLISFSYNMGEEVKMQLIKRVIESIDGDKGLVYKLLYLINYNNGTILDFTEKQKEELLELLSPFN